MTAKAVAYRQLLETSVRPAGVVRRDWLALRNPNDAGIQLFPLAYMLLSFFNAYYRYPTLLRKIEGRMSAEECGDRARGMGAKTTLLNMGWCMPGYYINGRELLINMGLVRPEDAIEDLIYVIDFWRRFQLAYHRNDGHVMTREFGHRSQIQPERQLQIFEADALPVVAGDPLHAAAIKFMAPPFPYSVPVALRMPNGHLQRGPLQVRRRSRNACARFCRSRAMRLPLARRSCRQNSLQQPNHCRSWSRIRTSILLTIGEASSSSWSFVPTTSSVSTR